MIFLSGILEFLNKATYLSIQRMQHAKSLTIMNRFDNRVF